MESSKPDGQGKNAVYNSFLVRCWQEGETWRYSLELIGRDSRQQKRQGFDGLPALLAALENDLMRLQERDPSGSVPNSDV